MKKILLLLTAVVLLTPAMAKKKQPTQQTDREYWAALAYKMAQPVLENMAKGELQKNMKTEFSPSFDNRNRKVAYMETFGRLMAGIAPWLTLPDEWLPPPPLRPPPPPRCASAGVALSARAAMIRTIAFEVFISCSFLLVCFCFLFVVGFQCCWLLWLRTPFLMQKYNHSMGKIPLA